MSNYRCWCLSYFRGCFRCQHDVEYRVLKQHVLPGEMSNVISITCFSITHFDLPKPILRKLSTGARKITVLKISLNNSTPGLLNSKLIACHWLDWLKLILRILRSSYLNSNSGFVICWTVQNLELFNKILNKKESFSARNM